MGQFIWSLPCAEQAGRPGRGFAVHGVQHAYRSDLARGRKRSDVSPRPPPVMTPICCARPYAITGDRPRKSAFGFRGEENQLAPKVTPRGRAGGDGLAPRFRRSPRGVSIRHTHSVSHAFPRRDAELHGIVFAPQTGRAQHRAIK